MEQVKEWPVAMHGDQWEQLVTTWDAAIEALKEQIRKACEQQADKDSKECQ